MALVTNTFGKRSNDIRIAQVFFLRNMAHGEMFADQKCNQFGILFGHCMLTTKLIDLHNAKFGVVATTSFCNVMKQRGDVQDMGLVPTCSQLRAKRVFVGMVCNEKTPDIAQHHHDVLIDGVDMKQVMLHLTHNVSEHPQISTQYRGLIHQPEGMCDALVLLQNF